MIIQLVKTTAGNLYLRLFGPRRSLFYEWREDGDFELCLPPPPENLALAEVAQKMV